MSDRPVWAVRGTEILVPSGQNAHELLPVAGICLSAAGADLSGAEEACELPLRGGTPHGEGRAFRFAEASPAPEGWEWMSIRQAVRNLPEEAWAGAARAVSLMNWRATTRFCGRCGSPSQDQAGGMARVCPSCGLQSFPRVSPAVLAVILREGRLLLARNAQGTHGFWSLLAGFVEPGERFEDCVRREVREEVGIEVAVEGYLGSQPWPFPDQLMIGFSGEWMAGELCPDGTEIAEAGWFGPHDHPPLPPSGSLSRRLIDQAFSRLPPWRMA